MCILTVPTFLPLSLSTAAWCTSITVYKAVASLSMMESVGSPTITGLALTTSPARSSDAGEYSVRQVAEWKTSCSHSLSSSLSTRKQRSHPPEFTLRWIPREQIWQSSETSNLKNGPNPFINKAEGDTTASLHPHLAVHFPGWLWILELLDISLTIPQNGLYHD